MAKRMARKKRYWGIDDGYGDGNGSINEGTGETFDPGTPEEPKDTEWDRFLKTGELVVPYYVSPYIKPKRRNTDQWIDPLSHITVEILKGDGTVESMWIVGQGAIDQDDEAMWEGPADKHTTAKFPVFFKTMAGLMAKGEEVSVDVLGMGLPVEYEEDEERHQILKDIVLGTAWHQTRITLADGTVLNSSVNFKDLVIKKQAEAALFDQFLDDDGEVTDTQIPKDFNLVVDVGMGTLNAFGIRSLKPVDKLIFQTGDGMHVAYDYIRHRLIDLRGENINDLILIPSIIKDGTYLDKNSNEVEIIESIVEPVYDTHASKVVGTVKTKAKNWMGQIRRIIWVGGGPAQMRPWIEKYFNQPNVIQVFADRFANARGSRKIAARYDKVKMKKLEQAQANAEAENTVTQ